MKSQDYSPVTGQTHLKTSLAQPAFFSPKGATPRQVKAWPASRGMGRSETDAYE